MNESYAQVKVENEKAKIIIPITSSIKPIIPDTLLKKWENILNLCAQILHVPSALIMKMNSENIEVFASSKTDGNPYHKGESEKLGLGLYCETVVGKRQQLLVPNSYKSEYWKNNPDVKLGMISYLGLPLEWNDGEIFGTFCVLDNKENKYSKVYNDILLQFKYIVEADLNQLSLLAELKEKLSDSELKIREVHHRIKNHFNVLISSIRLQSKNVNNESEIKAVLANISNRIRAFSLIHEKLYKAIDLSNFSISTYLKELCSHVVSNLSATNVELIIQADDIILESEVTLSIGQIITELITNSIKHAFLDVKDPTINIQLKTISSNQFTIIYEDNGSGISSKQDFGHNGSFGTLIIESLINKLHSNLEIIEHTGYKCKFEVKI